MKVTATHIPDVRIIEPEVFRDPRGFFFESFHERKWGEEIDASVRFVQDNHSRSTKGVLRGLHYQIGHPQGKLVRVVSGSVFDVAVDLRRSSPTFGRWVGAELSADNHRQMWVPVGFAHGFLVLTEFAEFLYKTTDFYSPADERCIRWDDPEIGVEWPISATPLVSEKDQRGARFKDAECFP